MGRSWQVAPVLLALCACGGASPPAAPIAALTEPALEPRWQRTATAGDALLRLLPEGPELVIELDLARARANPSLGPAVRALLEAPAGRSLAGLPEAAPLESVSALILASYDLGTVQAQTLTLLATDDAAALAARLGGQVIDGAVAVGPPALLAAVTARAVTPASLLRLRARAMPPAAAGAVLRASAALSLEARLSLARHAGLDPPPAALSVWLDLADDAALVAHVHGGETDDPGASARLRAALRGAISAFADEPEVTALGLAPSLRAAEISEAEGWQRVVVVVSPTRLRRAGDRARALAAAATAAPPPKGPEP